MNESQLRVYAVWDAPVRWFHWINVICIIVISGLSLVTIYHNELALEREARDLLKTLHVYVGYVFTANLVWRIIWAFCGNRFARWKAMLPFGRGYGKAALGYVASLRTEHPRQYLGHNPLGRLAVAAILLTLVVIAVTGLVRAGTDLYLPPFGGIVAKHLAKPGVSAKTLRANPSDRSLVQNKLRQELRPARQTFGVVHRWGSYILWLLIVVHIAGVVITEQREGGALVSAMLTGNKMLTGTPEDAD